MKRAISGALLTVLSFSLPAMAATSENFQFKGQSASASFYQSDECSSTGVSVWAADSVSRSAPGAPTSEKAANVSYWNSNWCTGKYSYGYGYAPNVTFTANNQLSSASLKGTFKVDEYSSENPESTTSKTVDVALNWTGTGEISRGMSHSRYQWMGGMSNYRSVGSYRTADVSGSVTMDGKNLIANLSGFGDLNSSSSGSVQITKR
jgi:hypothetical protein